MSDQYLPIGQAAEYLGVSIDTLRRWEEKGKIVAKRPDGRNRVFLVSDLEKTKFGDTLTVAEAAERLSMSASSLRRLSDEGKIKFKLGENGYRLYQISDLEEFVNAEDRGSLDAVLRNAVHQGIRESKATQPSQRVRFAQIYHTLENLNKHKLLWNVAFGAMVVILMYFVLPIFVIWLAFLIRPTQTAEFFRLRQQRENLPKVLGISTISDQNEVPMALSSMLRTPTETTLRIMRMTTPAVVEGIPLPSEQAAILPSIPGPPGPVGESGQVGATGPQGLPGLQGLAGVVGPAGATGAQGIQGLQGIQGIQGEAGSGGLALPLDLGTSNATGTLAVGKGGTGANMLTLNGVLYGNGTSAVAALTPGTSGYVLQSNGTGSPPSWFALPGLTFAGNSGSGSLALGGTLSVVGAGINNSSYSAGTLTITGTEADTLASVTGRGATTATALTLSNSANSVTAGTLTTTGGTINGTTIGATSATTGVFTTVNGLTITNNGSNTLNIAAGKTLAVNSSLTLAGTDGTTMTFPGSSDTVAGLGTTQTFTKPNTFSLGANAGVALTVNATTNSTPSDAVDVNLTHTSGTATNGLYLQMNGSGGVTTNGVNVTQTAGTLTNGLNLSGAIANGLTFAGTSFTKLINSTNFNITNTGAVTGGTYNGLTLSSASDGFTVAGGTTGRTLTVTGADVTVGSTIKPTSAGALSVQSNGANAITLDTGSAATINIGNTNASAIALGNGSQNTTLTLTGAGLTTLGGGLTFSGSSARTITGPSTGGLTMTVGSGPLALSTTSSGLLSLTSAGALSLTGAAPSTWDIGANILSLQTTNNGAITTGTGLLTHGGDITFSGSSVRTITGPNTGAAGSLVLKTTGNLSGLTLNTAAGASGNSGAIALKTGDTATSGTSGAVTIDVGAGAVANGTITVGGTNASALAIGRSTVTTSINGITDANNLKIGSGTTILKHLSASGSITAGATLPSTCGAAGTITVTGANAGDTAIGTPTPVSGGIETKSMVWNAYVSAADTVTIRVCNISALSVTPSTQTWRADVWQH